VYGGDREMRIQQEMMLGIGGFRALEALGQQPAVFHMNEGHSAFLALERIRRLMAAHGLAFGVARTAAAGGLVFTTHTPVAAGHDYFGPELMDRYLGAYPGYLGLGRRNPDDDREDFCMTVLALRLADRSNAVSRLHGDVSREAWQELWPGVPEAEIPIGHVTNGVHFQSWISREMNDLYDANLDRAHNERPTSSVLTGYSLWRH